MEYVAEQVKVVDKPSNGQRVNAVVASVEQGVLKDFIDFETLLKWKEKQPEKPCIKVTAQLENGDKRYIVLSLPSDGKSAHHLSKLAKWIKSYAGAPKEGQQIYLIADGQGYYQFHL